MDARTRHAAKVPAIAAQVREMAANGTHASLQKGSVSHTVPDATNPKHADRKIDVKGLTDVIEIDEQARTCVAESGVTFAKLVTETLAVGLVPKTVSELKHITIGGAVAGCSVESMSYKHGGFHDSCLAYEVVTGTGDVLTCTRDDADAAKRELFEMVHGSFGTLGILTCLTFELVPAKPYVRLDYQRYADFPAFQAAIEAHFEAQEVDFLDGIIHAPDLLVLVTGTFVDAAPYTHTYLWVNGPFYQSTRRRKRDYMETRHYFFRYDADLHWITRNYHLENPLVRFLFGPLVLGSTNVIRLSKHLGFLFEKSDRPDIVLDCFVPNAKFRDWFEWYRAEFDYWPVWIVPYKIARVYDWINPEFIDPADARAQLFIDWAIYGFQQPPDRNYYKLLEDKLVEVKGIKTLIAKNYYDEETFWTIHHRAQYEKVKARVDPQNLFRDLYHKMNYTGQ